MYSMCARGTYLQASFCISRITDITTYIDKGTSSPSPVLVHTCVHIGSSILLEWPPSSAEMCLQFIQTSI